MLTVMLHDLQGTARAAPAIPGLEQGNPAQTNRPVAPATPRVAGTSGAPGDAPVIAGPRTSKEINDQIQNDIRSSIRNGGNPQIVIPPDFVRNAVPQGAVDISIAMFVTIAIIIVGLPIARALGRRMDRRSDSLASGAANLAPQIAQLQDSIDAMAIELERVTEGQRFQNKLLAGKAEEPVKLPR